MNRRTTLSMTTTALVCLVVGISTSGSVAQQRSLKEQLLGTWTLVSSNQVLPDGRKEKQFGGSPRGINIFDPNGRFFLMIANPHFLMVASADIANAVSNDLSKTNSEEFGGLISESIAYYGTYALNEAETVVILHLDASTFPNQVGTKQERAISFPTADQLIMKYSNPAAMSGVQVHQLWKRTE
jgi:hypothetical protein